MGNVPVRGPDLNQGEVVLFMVVGYIFAMMYSVPCVANDATSGAFH